MFWKHSLDQLLAHVDSESFIRSFYRWAREAAPPRSGGTVDDGKAWLIYLWKVKVSRREELFSNHYYVCVWIGSASNRSRGQGLKDRSFLLGSIPSWERALIISVSLSFRPPQKRNSPVFVLKLLGVIWLGHYFKPTCQSSALTLNTRGTSDAYFLSHPIPTIFIYWIKI